MGRNRFTPRYGGHGQESPYWHHRLRRPTRVD